ncbi:MAG TPA: hypothetical protein VGA69_04920 [Nitriliruptorales bacterium]
MGWSEFYRESTAWHGIATSAQAVSHGISDRTFRRRAADEAWHQPLAGSGVRQLPGSPPTPITQLAAALAHVGYPAAVTRGSALHLHGLRPKMPQRVQLLLPAGRTAPEVPGIEVVRTRHYLPHHLEDIKGLCCVRPARAVTDLANVQRLADLRSLVIDLRFRDGDVLDELDRVHRERGRYPGRADVRRILADLSGDGSDSGFEFTTRERLVAGDLPPDEGQAVVRTPTRTIHIDIPFGSRRVGIECLGWAYHSSRAQLHRDAVRWNALAEVDEWLILQLTWSMLWGPAWEQFVAQLRRTLARRT